ncbi:MAG TPA: RHS repeat-associated core domain-containing protein [Vicinamibacteria bacterium]
MTPPPAYPQFSTPATTEEIQRARVFGEPLLALGTPSAAENQELAHAISDYLHGTSNEQTGPFENFLATHPDSAWRASLLANLGALYRRLAFYTRAEKALREAWERAKESGEPAGRAIADQAVGELVEIYMQFGHLEPLEAVLAQAEGRELLGGSAEHIRGAKATAWGLRNRHEDALPSGPISVERLFKHLHPSTARPEKLKKFHGTVEGMSLREVKDLAASVGIEAEAAVQEPGTTPVVPSIIHLKQNHFSMLARQEGDYFVLDDPLLGGEVWLSRQALLEEMSGYSLVPTTTLPPRLKKANLEDLNKVRGKCHWPIPEPGKPCASGDPLCQPPVTPCPTCPPPPMASYSFQALLTALHISDTPVSYTPPRGPAIRFGVSYHQREAFQPQTFTFSNFGRKWLFDWVLYVEDNPANLSAPVDSYMPGGGKETYSGFDGTSSYAPDRDSRSVLVRTSTSPIRYEKRFADGSIEVYAQPDGAMSFPRRIFLTQQIDPQGNAISLTYDGQLRLVAVTDAIGQVSTISYELASDPLKITKITDPFGRFATFEYNATGQLSKVTDPIGISSAFEYGAGDFVRALTTPYGTTTFTSGPGPNPTNDLYVQAVDPLGGTERLEYIYDSGATIPATETAVPPGFAQNNTSLNRFNSFYWDKLAMARYPGDYTKARAMRWLFSETYKVSGPISTEKPALQSRIWYGQAGDTMGHGVGPDSRPVKVARLLDDGSAQIFRYEYNSKGKKTRETDPMGRETVYEYDANDIDLLRVKQKNGTTYELLQSFTYNSQHLPLTVTDAAGQTTTYTYNSAGQVLTVTTPARSGITENRTTTYSYDSNGYLQSVTAPVTGATTSYTYDSAGRIRTVTDADSYTTTTDYDAIDRPTKITDPDGTYEEIVYNRLDPERRRDRLGRWSESFYDPLRRVVATRDPLGRTVNQQWCGCGSLDKLTDGNGNATSWERDVRGRVTKETRADGAYWEYTYETTTSRLKKVKDAKGQETQYSYFLDNKLQQVSYPTAQIVTPSVSFTYDAAYGRLATIVDGTGTTTYSYHAITGTPPLGAGQLASVDGPLTNDTVSYTYDELGRIATRTLNSVTTSYTYDVLGRLTTLGDPLGSFTHAYVGTTSRLASLTYPNGQQSTYAYHPNSGDKRLHEIHHRASAGGTTLSKFSYTYDPVGNIKTWTQQYAATTNAYDLGYDPADQLSSALYHDTATPPVTLKRYAYGYDNAANRTAEQIDDAPTLSIHDNRNRLTSQQPGGALLFAGTVSEPATVTIAGKPATATADNRFQGTAQVGSGTSTVTVTATDPSGNVAIKTYQVSASGSTTSFTYDPNGSLTAQGTKTYEWDGANRLVRIVDGGSEIARFVYDGQGRRSQKITGGLTRTYVYDGAEILEERLSSGGTIRYVHGQGIDQHLAKVEGGTTSYYLADHLGSIIQVTDAGAAVMLTRQYDAWGNLLQGAAISGYAFAGGEWDSQAGFYWYRARCYDPKLGRFISEDPIRLRGGINVYAYVFNNPARWIDPTGHGGVAPTPAPSRRPPELSVPPRRVVAPRPSVPPHSGASSPEFSDCYYSCMFDFGPGGGTLALIFICAPIGFATIEIGGLPGGACAVVVGLYCREVCKSRCEIGPPARQPDEGPEEPPLPPPRAPVRWPPGRSG